MDNNNEHEFIEFAQHILDTYFDGYDFFFDREENKPFSPMEVVTMYRYEKAKDNPCGSVKSEPMEQPAEKTPTLSKEAAKVLFDGENNEGKSFFQILKEQNEFLRDKVRNMEQKLIEDEKLLNGFRKDIGYGEIRG